MELIMNWKPAGIGRAFPGRLMLFFLCLSLPAAVSSSELPEYRVGNWKFNDRGNHRAVVSVSAPAEAVFVRIPWRRRDTSPEKKAVLVYHAFTDQEIKEVLILKNQREYCQMVFKAAAAGEYHIYYLPYQEPVHWAGDPGSYYPPRTRPEDAWSRSARSRLDSLPQARMVAIESKSAFDSMYPMEVPMTEAELTAFLGRHAADDYLVFPEDRSRPIRMQDQLPYLWLKRDLTAGFSGTARPGEIYALQLGVYAKEKNLENLKLAYSGLSSDDGVVRIPPDRFECLNLSGTTPLGQRFTKLLNVAQGKVQPLWILIHVPSKASGELKGSITVSGSNFTSRHIPVTLRVAGDAPEYGGAADLSSMARLSWLNSTRGLEPTLLPGFSPVTRNGNQINLLDRSLTFNDIGLPDSIISRGIELLARPISFQVTANGKTQQFHPAAGLRFTTERPDQISFNVRSRSEFFTRTTAVRTEFDGAVFFTLELHADHAVNISDIQLKLPFRQEAVPYLMGMGQRGGRAPESLLWSWKDTGSSLLWQGDVHAGLQLKLEREQETWGDSGEMNGKQSMPPLSWDNGGRGICRVERLPGNIAMTEISTGKRAMKAGDTLRFHFRLLVTPFKRLNPGHWNYRWQSQWGGSGDADFNMALLFHGDASCGNSFINYPFLELDQMKRWIDNIQTRRPCITYPAAGNINLASGSLEVTFRPEIVPAHHGPGSPGYQLAALRFPGGDELGLFWNPEIQGFTARIRDGYQGVRPQYPTHIHYPCPERPKGVPIQLRMSWRENLLHLEADGTPVGTGVYTLSGKNLKNATLVLYQNPQFPVHSLTVRDRAEGGKILLADDFTRIQSQHSIPRISGNSIPGGIQGKLIAPATPEHPAPRMEPVIDRTRCMPVLYYTVRELSNHAPELWALRSLGDEIFSESAVITAPDAVSASGQGGGYPWLREHLRDNYSPAWRMPMGTFNDASIGTRGLSRWHNYYVEGMNFLMQTGNIEGLYLDGIGYNRDIMRRMARVLKKKNPGNHINIHSGNNYDFCGWHLSPMNVYMEHLPFLDSLWLGELYSYDRDPDYWLVEISGIPFGVPSEMLNYESGGNPCRGMVYGMTGRIHPSASAMWAFWDEFRIQDAQWIGYWEKNFPIRASRNDVRASIYRKPKECLIAIGHWPEGGLGRSLEISPVEHAPDREQWKRIQPAGNFFRVGGETTPVDSATGTELRIAGNEEYCFLQFSCNYTGALKAGVTGRDGEVWSDDSVDLIFLPDSDNVIHLIANAGGALWDARNGDAAWNGRWQYSADRNEKNWTGTLAVKWSDLTGKPGIPERLRFNMFRTAYRPQASYSCWSPAATYGDHANLGRLFAPGKMPLAGLFSPNDEVSVALEIDYPALGLDPAKLQFEVPDINYVQKARPLSSAADIRFPAGKGILFIVREKQ